MKTTLQSLLKKSRTIKATLITTRIIRQKETRMVKMRSLVDSWASKASTKSRKGPSVATLKKVDSIGSTLEE